MLQADRGNIRIGGEFQAAQTEEQATLREEEEHVKREECGKDQVEHYS